MLARVRPLLLPTALVAALFALTTLAGYVYSHEPSRDELVVQYEGTPVPQPAYLLGSVVGLEGGTLSIATAPGGTRDVVVPQGTPLEVLERSQGAPETGSRVNVGVDDTDFGLVLTGIVTIAEPR